MSSTTNAEPLNRDVPCISCGYNLRGMAPASTCPECNAPVEDSLRGDIQRLGVHAIRRIRLGLALAAAALVLATLAAGAIAWELSFPFATPTEAWAITIVLASLVFTAGPWCLALWFIATPGERNPDEPRTRCLTRKTVRVISWLAWAFALSPIPGAALAILVSLPRWPTGGGFAAVAIVLGGVAAIAFWLGAILSFPFAAIYARRLARRASDEPARKRATAVLILTPIAVAALITAAFLADQPQYRTYLSYIIPAAAIITLFPITVGLLFLLRLRKTLRPIARITSPASPATVSSAATA
ncbi:MAG: hypothetical protein VYC34_05880 [Planctomycetota bacterium]|nr:hypothetical protein [Planctomycetota bacterium]